MSNFHYYLWIIYGIGSLGLIYLCWRVVRTIKLRFLRDLILGFIILLLLIPWYVMPGKFELAPALIILLHEQIFNAEVNAWRAAWPVLLAYLLFIPLLSLCYWIVGRKRLHSNTVATTDVGTEDGSVQS